MLQMMLTFSLLNSPKAGLHVSSASSGTHLLVVHRQAMAIVYPFLLSLRQVHAKSFQCRKVLRLMQHLKCQSKSRQQPNDHLLAITQICLLHTHTLWPPLTLIHTLLAPLPSQHMYSK